MSLTCRMRGGRSGNFPPCCEAWVKHVHAKKLDFVLSAVEENASDNMETYYTYL